VPSAPPPDWVLGRRRVIGDQIRAARREAGLSQEKLAELAGMDRQSINRIEQGHQAALIDNLIRIADALGVPLAELVRDGPAAATGEAVGGP
jgi:transcriptional regulator with XRE-family HTH domain